MIYFGCLPLVIIVIGLVLLASVLNLGLRLVNNLGATVIWLWESFLNLFRTEKKEVVNPWSGESNFDKAPTQDRDIAYRPTEQRPKRYDASDGDYVDYTDIK